MEERRKSKRGKREGGREGRGKRGGGREGKERKGTEGEVGRKKRREERQKERKDEVEGEYKITWSCVQLNSQVSIAASIHIPVNCSKHLPGIGMNLE